MHHQSEMRREEERNDQSLQQEMQCTSFQLLAQQHRLRKPWVVCTINLQ
jgi:hypothetical protein